MSDLSQQELIVPPPFPEDLEAFTADVKVFLAGAENGIEAGLEFLSRGASEAVIERLKRVRDESLSDLVTFCAYVEGCVEINLRKLGGAA